MKYLIYIISFLFICNINTSLASNNKIVIEDDLTDKDSKNQAPLLRHDIEEGDHNPSSGALVSLDGSLELDTPGKVQCYNCCKGAWDYYRIISGYTLEFLALYSNTAGTFGGIALTICAGIDKYIDLNDPIHKSLSTAGVTIGIIVTGSALLGGWAKKEGDRRLSLTQKTLQERHIKVDKLKAKVATLKSQS